MASLSQYNNMSSAYSDMECVVILKVMGKKFGCWRIFCARGSIDKIKREGLNRQPCRHERDRLNLSDMTPFVFIIAD